MKSANFAPLEYTGMQLVAAQEFALDLNLQAAGVSETVTVVGTADALDISSARIGVNVSEREVQNLPVNGRQMSQLMLQAPGSQNAGTGTWNDVRFSGQANQQNVIKFDGVEGSAIIDASPGNLNGQIPSPFKLQASLENVQEFRVESNNYPAEFGTGTGGQVNVVTKSGSNTLPRLGVRVLPRRQVRRAELLRRDAQQRRQRDSGAAEVGAQPAPVRRLGRRPARRRIARSSSAATKAIASMPASTSSKRAPSAAAWARAVPAIAPLRPGFTAPERGAAARRVGERRLRHLPAAEPRRSARELVQRPPRLPAQPEVERLRPRVPRRRRADPSGRRQRPRRARDQQADQRASSTCTASCRSGLQNEFKVGYNAPPTTHRRRGADGQRHRLRQPRRST